MPEWFKKAEFLANMAVVKNSNIWIKKDDTLLLYVPFKIRQRLLFVVHEDLLLGRDGVKKCKQRLMECFFTEHG
jgi:hypothetical protein